MVKPTQKPLKNKEREEIALNYKYSLPKSRICKQGSRPSCTLWAGLVFGVPQETATRAGAPTTTHQVLTPHQTPKVQRHHSTVLSSTKWASHSYINTKFMTLKDLKFLRPNALVLLLQLMKPQNKHCKAVLPSFLLQFSGALKLQCPSLKKTSLYSAHFR